MSLLGRRERDTGLPKIGKAKGQGTIQVDTAGWPAVRLGVTDSAAPGTRSHSLAKSPASGEEGSIPTGGGESLGL